MNVEASESSVQRFSGSSMRRIVVVGTSGSGKTTLARQLGTLLGMPFVELDALHWEPNWTSAALSVLRERVDVALSGDAWVVDGNYSKVRDLTWGRADTVVWLDYNLWVIMTRLARRTFTRIFSREELWSGNRERVWITFFSKDSILLWALQTYRKNWRLYAELPRQPEYAHLNVVYLRSPQDTHVWLTGVMQEERKRKELPMSEIDNPNGDSLKETHGVSMERDRAATFTPLTEEQLRVAHVGELLPLVGRIYIADYDPEWPRLFAREAERVLVALGDRVLLLEHVGSTSVPGLAAKPRIDMLLVVANSADEPAYAPALEAAAYLLHIREPDWYEHRLFKGPATDINLHVFSQGCPEIARMLLFRDWLRGHEADRRLYERTKRDLASRNWKYTQNYADAKTTVVEEILARARGMGEKQ